MKYFKILFIFLLTFILVGCSKSNEDKSIIYYNLDISTYFKENITFLLDRNAYEIAKNYDGTGEPLEYTLLYDNINPIFSNYNDFYKKDIDKRLNDIKVNLSYNYIEDDFAYSSYIMNCFENYDITSNEDSFEILLSGEFYCLNDNGKDSINIKVSSDFDTKFSNGILEDNAYVWNINKNNTEDVYIEHAVSRNYEGMVSDREELNNIKSSGINWDLIKMIGLVIILVGLIIVSKKYKKES